MAVSEELLKILVCPDCKTELGLVPDGDALECAVCGNVYRIEDDIPIMLPDEATTEG